MALAILELLEFEKGNCRFRIDTGTNRYYQMKVGRNVQRRSGLDWVDDVFIATPMAMNPAGGAFLGTSKEISLPVGPRDRSGAYVQLLSFKTPEGKSPAFSRVVKVHAGLNDPALLDLAPSFARSASMDMTEPFRDHRTIPTRLYADAYARQASLEDLLAGILKVAGPLVGALPVGPSSGTAGNGGNSGPAGIIAALLSAVLGGGAGISVSKSQSSNGKAYPGNRFAGLSQPFIFGIDDALLGALIGPVVQALPQLLNAANQKRVQMKQADNKLVTDVLSEVNRRILLEKLMQARQAPAAGAPPGNSADMDQLIQLLQQASAGGAAPAAPVAGSQSFSANISSGTLSSKAMLAFVMAEPVPWNGVPKAVFARNQDWNLKIRLNVADPAPTTPLPKAILKVVFKDPANQTIVCEKTFKQKNLLPNSVMLLPFARNELTHLPTNKPISIFAEMRWLSSKTRKEFKALGSAEIVLVNKYSMKEQGREASPEQELTDMKRFKPFWNKIWEAPTLDAVSAKSGGQKKYLWELNVGAKYSVLLSADHNANGLMQTKILRGPVDDDTLTELTDGRLKAGIELSIAELNKLIPLWSGPPLEADRLEAFNTAEFAKNNAGEFVYNLKLKGRAGERGMIWVVPTFKLFEFTLQAIQNTDDTGQVVRFSEEKFRFPLPVSARVIGLKSKT